MSQSQLDAAPWNEPLVPDMNFSLNVVVTLSRDVEITTNNYTQEFDEENGYMYANTENTEWAVEYKNKCYTIPELLEILKGYIKQDLERYKYARHKSRELKAILEACDCWTVEELSVEEI